LVNYGKHRRYEDARLAYLRVLELDPRNAVALGFLGIVYHLLGDLDGAIVKYHEVCNSFLKERPLIMST